MRWNVGLQEEELWKALFAPAVCLSDHSINNNSNSQDFLNKNESISWFPFWCLREVGPKKSKGPKGLDQFLLKDPSHVIHLTLFRIWNNLSVLRNTQECCSYVHLSILKDGCGRVEQGLEKSNSDISVVKMGTLIDCIYIQWTGFHEGGRAFAWHPVTKNSLPPTHIFRISAASLFPKPAINQSCAEMQHLPSYSASCFYLLPVEVLLWV